MLLLLKKSLILCFFICFIAVESCQSRASRPRIKYSPQPDEDSSLIYYNFEDKSSSQVYINELNKFLAPYLSREKHPNVERCEQEQLPSAGKVCDFSLGADFAPCVSDFGYGYDLEGGGPCVFLYLEKILDWTPGIPKNVTFPADMPSSLKEYIKFREHQADKDSSAFIWLYCDGETPTDKENIGPISYHPFRGFSSKYFPFKNIEGYLSPLVAVHFEKPRRGILINIGCKVWAPNIIHDETEKDGLVNFELMID